MARSWGSGSVRIKLFFLLFSFLLHLCVWVGAAVQKIEKRRAPAWMTWPGIAVWPSWGSLELDSLGREVERHTSFKCKYIREKSKRERERGWIHSGSKKEDTDDNCKDSVVI